MGVPISEIKDYSEFGDNRVYLLMAIARKKENPDITSSSEIVFREVVKDEKDIERKIEKLRNACENYGDAEKFRLYYSANARNTLDAYFNFRIVMNSWAEKKLNGQKDIDRKFKRIDSHWKSELQKPGSRDESNFIYDLDSKSMESREVLLEELEKHTEVKKRVSTPNGHHFIVEPFNHNKLKEFDFEVERKNDGMFFVGYI